MKLNTLAITAFFAVAPAATFAQDWSGAYAGFQIGGSQIDVDGAGPGVDGDGPSYGLFAGLNMQSGNIVYGAEIDYDTTEYDIDEASVEVDSTTRIKGRIGTEVGGGLAYGTAGAVWATSPELGDGNGYLFGFGYDLAVTTNMTVGAEVLQHEFDDYNDTGLDVGVTTFKARVAFNF